MVIKEEQIEGFEHCRQQRELVSYGPRFKENIVKRDEWTASMNGFGEILPYHDNKMTLNYEKKDQWGLPTVTFDAKIRRK